MDTTVNDHAAPAAPAGAEKPQRHLFTIFRTFLRWTVIGLAIGLLVGAIGTALWFSVKLSTNLRSNLPWLLYFLPVAGLLSVAIYRFFGYKHDKGTNLCLLAVRDDEQISPWKAFCIFFGTVLSHLCGASVGREGAALQIGGSTAAFVGRKLKLDEEDTRIIILCGMSACFAAMSGTPIAAAIFSLEIISVGVLYYSALLPCVISAITGTMLASAFGAHPLQAVVDFPALTVSSLLRVGVLGVACAGISWVFCMALKYGTRIYKKFLKNSYLRILVGGALAVGITLLIGSQTYNGAGFATIQAAFLDHSGWQVFALKLLLTVITIGAGFKGGEIIPALFVGATFGSAAAELLALSPSAGAAVGLVAVFCGITNCPITALLIGVEMCGGSGLIFYGVAVTISYLLSGYTGLFSEQRILYSKIKPRLIDRRIGDSRPNAISEKLGISGRTEELSAAAEEAEEAADPITEKKS